MNMKTRTFLLASFLVMAPLVTGTTSAVSAADTGAKLAVVVAKDFPVDELSFGDLKRLYMGDPINVGGKRLIPLALPPRSAERVSFDESVLGMNPDEVGRYWIDRKIRGQSGAPKALDSGDLLVRVVGKVEGAVGYVHATTVGPNVKVLRIDGKGPNDPSYRVGG